jgi:hypothetical protein
MHPIALLLAALLAVSGGAFAQNRPALVNGEPVTGGDVFQAILWQGHIDRCIERVKTLLTGEVFHPKDREPCSGQCPRAQEEAQQIAERIKKRVIADAIEEAAGNKLKLQAAKKLGITVSDAEVEEILAVCAGPGPDGKPDMTTLYSSLKQFNVKPEAVQGIVRVQLAWRKMIRHMRSAGNGFGADPRDATDESFPRRYLQELGQKAIIEYRDSHPE